MNDLDISGGNIFGDMLDDVDGLVGDLSGNHDGTAGEAGSGPGEMHDEVDENGSTVDERAESIADDIENGPDWGPEHTKSKLRDIHNDIVDAENSSNPETRDAAERAKQELQDRGLWDEDYANQRREEKANEDENPEDEPASDDEVSPEEGSDDEEGAGDGNGVILPH